MDFRAEKARSLAERAKTNVKNEKLEHTTESFARILEEVKKAAGRGRFWVELSLHEPLRIDTKLLKKRLKQAGYIVHFYGLTRIYVSWYPSDFSELKNYIKNLFKS